MSIFNLKRSKTSKRQSAKSSKSRTSNKKQKQTTGQPVSEKPSTASTNTSTNTAATSAAHPSAQESSNFETFSFVLLGFVIFLLPLFYLPFWELPLWINKMALITGGGLVSFIFFLIFSLKKNLLFYRKSAVLAAVWLLPIVYFFSAVFSADLSGALGGRFFEPGTCASITLMALLLSLSAVLLRSRKRLFSFLCTVLFSGLLLLILEFIFVFLSLNPFASSSAGALTQTLLGGWNNLAILAGLLAVLSILMLENIKAGWFFKVVLYLLLIFSLFSLMMVNFSPAWLVLSIFSFGLVVYFFFKHRIGWSEHAFVKKGSSQKSTHGVRFFILPLFVFLLSISFFLGGSTFSKCLSGLPPVSEMEARPSYSATLSVAEEVYAENWLLGSGPSTFENQWAKFKPEAINNSIFWNKSFSTGVGFLSTEFSTIGALGIVAWSIFLLVFLLSGAINLLIKRAYDEFSYFLTLVAFLGALYLWAVLMFYDAGPVLIALAFAFTGGFTACIPLLEGKREKEVMYFSKRPRVGFVLVFVMSLLVIAAAVWLYTGAEKYVANVYFNRALILHNEGKLKQSKGYLGTVVGLDESDVYHREFAEVELKRIEKLFKDKKTLKSDEQETFREILASAIDNARRAKNIDSQDYRNWVQLGDVYASVVPLRIQGSFEKAKQMYKGAMELSPSNPRIYLKMAEVEMARKNFKKAREYARQALEIKNNYTEAVYLLSQTYVAQGNIDSAISSTKSAIRMNSRTPALFFQLGLLYYKKQEYAKAANYLERATELTSRYANAKYYLGLAYHKVGKDEKALREFAELKKMNPDNEELGIIVENMKAGRDPFASIPEEKPKQKKKLPIEEQGPEGGSERLQ